MIINLTHLKYAASLIISNISDSWRNNISIFLNFPPRIKREADSGCGLALSHLSGAHLFRGTIWLNLELPSMTSVLTDPPPKVVTPAPTVAQSLPPRKATGTVRVTDSPTPRGPVSPTYCKR